MLPNIVGGGAVMKAGAFGRGPGKWRLDETTQRFVAAWQAGRRPNIEEHLEGSDAKSRPELLRELVVVEARCRREQGELVRSDDYANRFPELAVTEIEVLIESASVPAERSETLLPGASSSDKGDSAEEFGSLADSQPVTGSVLETSGDGASSEEDVSSSPRPGFKVDLVSLPADDVPPYVPPVEAPVTESIGRYRLGRVLGSGSFGEVLEATDPELDRKVALKLPRKERKLSKDAVQRFRAEGRVLARLRHPGLVAVYDAGVTPDGRPFVVSELIEGEDLQVRLERVGKMSVAEATRIVAEAAEALATAHIAGIVHRDVKPANLMLDRDDTVRVADFGIALPEDQQESARGEVLGSPAYMAPEQFSGEAHLLDGRADIWALGVVLYELLTGRRPFTSQTFEGLKEEVQRRDPRPLRQLNPKLPAWIDDVVAKCLAKRPADRYDTAADLAADLRRGEAGFAARRRSLLKGSLAGGVAAVCVVGLAAVAASLTDIRWPWQPVERDQPIVTIPEVPDPTIDTTPSVHKTVDPPGIVTPSQENPTVTVVPKVYPQPVEAERPVPTVIEPPEPLVAVRPVIAGEWLPEGAWPTADAERVPLSYAGNAYGWSRIVKPVQRADGSIIEVPFRLIPHQRESDPPAFYIMETKVWNDLFRVFAEAHPEMLPATRWTQGGEADGKSIGVDGDAAFLPVFRVRLREAAHFAEWLGGKLPRDVQWDKAAGFHDHTADVIGPFRSTSDGASDVAVGRNGAGPVPVGSSQDDVSPYQVREMAGNGWEFTRTQALAATELRDPDDKNWDEFVIVSLRGRHYNQEQPLNYSEWNFTYQRDAASHLTGFRVVLEQP